MNKSRTVRWKRLDHAAKIFPPTSNRQNTKVFRFSCSLYETIQEDKLQEALDRTMIEFPLYGAIIRKGLFWYYFEASDLKPKVTEENKSPCAVMYDENKKKLLFEVSYYKKRINLEIYHALTDGAGALQFLKTLVFHYLMLVHTEIALGSTPSLDYDASMAQKEDDSFNKYFYKGKGKKKDSLGKAYKIHGEKIEGNRLQIIRGTMSVKEVLKQAHAYDTTLTGFLGSLLVCSVAKEMSVRDKKKPVVLSVPVNLRTYFKSASARNFFSVINVGCHFREDIVLEDVIKQLNTTFQKELTTEQFKGRLNQLVALEHNYVTRCVPLILKKPTLRIAHYLTNEEITTVLSNIGRVTMPEEIAHYIDTFDVCVSTDKVQVCVCSYGDKLSISFTSPFKNTEIQKDFFRELTERGIKVQIATNINKE